MTYSLPEFPEGWKALQLRRVFCDVEGIRIGPFGSALTLNQMVEKGFKVYGQENVISGNFTAGTRFVEQSKYEELKACSIIPGDLLVTMMGTTGRCCEVPEYIETGIMDSHLIRLRFRPEDVVPSYMVLLIDKAHYIKEQISANGKGTIMSGLNSAIIKELWIGLPDTLAQHRIIKYVDEQTTKIDRLMEMRRRQITLLQEQRAAMIQQAVTRGLNPDAPMKDSGVSWLGEIPKHWQCSSLRRFWTVIDCKHLTVPFFEEGYPLASVSEVQSFELDLSQAKRTSWKYWKDLIEGGAAASCRRPHLLSQHECRCCGMCCIRRTNCYGAGCLPY